MKLIVKCLLIASLFYSVYFHVNLKTKPSLTTSHTNSWTQPAEANSQYPFKIEIKNEGFNYPSIEKLLWQFHSTQTNELIINAATSKQLELGCSYIDDKLSQTQGLQLKSRIEKSNPGKKGAQLSSLLIKYCRYQVEHAQLMQEANTAQPKELVASLSALMPKVDRLQNKYFSSALIKKLFSEKNLTAHYFNQRRLVNLNANLTLAQKQASLANLQAIYQQELEALKP